MTEGPGGVRLRPSRKEGLTGPAAAPFAERRTVRPGGYQTSVPEPPFLDKASLLPVRPEKSDICFGKADKLYNRLNPGALSGLTGGGKRGIIGAESRREAAWGAFPDGGRGKSTRPKGGGGRRR